MKSTLRSAEYATTFLVVPTLWTPSMLWSEFPLLILPSHY